MTGRTFPSLVAVPDTNAAILFGGSGSSELNDTWLFDNDAGTWLELWDRARWDEQLAEIDTADLDFVDDAGKVVE